MNPSNSLDRLVRFLIGSVFTCQLAFMIGTAWGDGDPPLLESGDGGTSPKFYHYLDSLDDVVARSAARDVDARFPEVVSDLVWDYPSMGYFGQRFIEDSLVARGVITSRNFVSHLTSRTDAYRGAARNVLFASGPGHARDLCRLLIAATAPVPARSEALDDFIDFHFTNEWRDPLNAIASAQDTDEELRVCAGALAKTNVFFALTAPQAELQGRSQCWRRSDNSALRHTLLRCTWPGGYVAWVASSENGVGIAAWTEWLLECLKSEFATDREEASRQLAIIDEAGRLGRGDRGRLIVQAAGDPSRLVRLRGMQVALQHSGFCRDGLDVESVFVYGRDAHEGARRLSIELLTKLEGEERLTPAESQRLCGVVIDELATRSYAHWLDIAYSLLDASAQFQSDCLKGAFVLGDTQLTWLMISFMGKHSQYATVRDACIAPLLQSPNHETRRRAADAVRQR